MLDLKVEITGLDEIKRRFQDSPSVVRKHTNAAIQKSVFTLLAEARKIAPVDRGFLRGAGMSFTFGDLMGVLQNKAPYAMFVHEGTQPHYVPLHAIQDWADRHGIPAFAVQRSIMRKGTKAQPFFQDSIAASRDTIDGYFNAAVAAICEAL